VTFPDKAPNQYYIPAWFKTEPSLHNTCQAVWIWSRALNTLGKRGERKGGTQEEDPLGILADPSTLEEVLLERSTYAWAYILEVGFEKLKAPYVSNSVDAAHVILALTSVYESGEELTEQQMKLAVLAEQGMMRNLGNVGVSPPPRGFEDQKLQALYLTAYARAAERDDLLVYCQDRLKRLIYYPAPLPTWWDGEVGSNCEKGPARCRSLPGSSKREDHQRCLDVKDAISAWGASAGAVALAFEDDTIEHALPLWASKACSGTEGRHLPMDFLKRANAAVPYNATLLLGLRGLLRSLADDNTPCSPRAPPAAPTQSTSGARISVQEAMKRLGWELKRFVDPFSCAASPDGDTEAPPHCWVGFLLAYALYGFSTRSGFAHMPYVPDEPADAVVNYEAMKEYMDRVARKNDKTRELLVEHKENRAFFEY